MWSSSCADLLDGVTGPFDAVLSNLPYVAEGSGLPPEIELYEPPVALFGGPDGLDLIRRLIATVADAGVPLVALEIGAGRGGRRHDAPRRLSVGPDPARSGRPRARRRRAAVTDAEAFERCIARRRGRAVPRRHGVRPGLRSQRPFRGRAAVPAEAAEPRQAIGGDVLRSRARAGRGARDRGADTRRDGAAAARGGDGAAPEPGGPPCARLRERSGDARTAGPAVRPWPRCGARCCSRARTGPAVPIRGRCRRFRRCCGPRSIW